MDNKPNNLPPEGWVLKMEHDHPRKGEVIKWFMREWHICYRDDQDFYTQEASFYKDDFHLPRLSMNEFIARTVDYKGNWEPLPHESVEVSDNGEHWLSTRYIGKDAKGNYVSEGSLGLYRHKQIRPLSTLTMTLSEAESLLSEIKKQVVKIEG